MALCAVAHIERVSPKGADAFIVRADQAFTQSKQSEVVLQCERPEVRRKWLRAFRAVAGERVEL